MQTTIQDITIQLVDDTVMIRDAKTNNLLRAKTFKAHEAMDKYKELIQIYQKKVAK